MRTLLSQQIPGHALFHNIVNDVAFKLDRYKSRPIQLVKVMVDKSVVSNVLGVTSR